MTEVHDCTKCGDFNCPRCMYTLRTVEVFDLTARNEALTQELDTIRDTLRHRSNALNATGTHNDQLRAQLAEIRDHHRRTYDSPSDEAYRRNPVCDHGCGTWPCLTHELAIVKEPTP